LGRECFSVVQCLPPMYVALDLIPSTTKKSKPKQFMFLFSFLVV
jgi:hypothetical protein